MRTGYRYYTRCATVQSLLKNPSMLRYTKENTSSQSCFSVCDVRTRLHNKVDRFFCAAKPAQNSSYFEGKKLHFFRIKFRIFWEMRKKNIVQEKLKLLIYVYQMREWISNELTNSQPIKILSAVSLPPLDAPLKVVGWGPLAIFHLPGLPLAKQGL